jgi:ABC-2 type transport system ATP-binding protein
MLVLDEPTAAVDPQLRSRFWETFRELAAGSATLFISTHLMDEAVLCDRIAVLRGEGSSPPTPLAASSSGASPVSS